tara:strand:- start:4349 stop:4636 length:288 start_codon:yes stop_codon:yes gene_type:complete
MAKKIEEIMERSGLTRTGLAVAYIKDGLDEISHMIEPYVTEATVNITADKRYYDLPTGMIKIRDIRVKNHDNDEDKYRSIPRIMYEPPEEDADGV